MSSIEIVQNPTTLSYSEEVTYLTVEEGPLNTITVEDGVCTLTSESEVTLLSIEPLEITLEVNTSTTSISVEDNTTTIAVDNSTVEVIEKCIQGPPGAVGPQGSGGVPIRVAIDPGQEVTISTKSLLFFCACNYQLSIRDLVQDWQVLNHIDFTWKSAGGVRCRKSGMNSKDPINFKINYNLTPTDFEVTIKNNQPNSLLITGLEFAIEI